MPDSSAPLESTTFETALEQLQQIVHDLEDGGLGLEVALARFGQGISLLRSCYQKLEQAEQKIEILTGVDADGNPLTAPFDATATIDAADKPSRKPGRRKTADKPAGPAKEATPPPDESADAGNRLF